MPSSPRPKNIDRTTGVTYGPAPTVGQRGYDWWDTKSRNEAPPPDGIRHPDWYPELKQDYQDSRNQAMNDWAPLPTLPGSPPKPTGGSPRGGGGGGAAQKKKEEQELAMRQAGMLQQLLGSRAFQARGIDAELGQVGSAVSADQAAAQAQYDQLGKFMGGLANPYEGMQMTQTPQVDPNLLRLIAANGGDQSGYNAQVQMANTMGAQGDAAADRLRQQMAASQQASNQSRQAETQMGATYANQELGAGKTAMEAALRQRQSEEQKGLDAQKMQVVMALITAMAEGGQGVDVAQFFK